MGDGQPPTLDEVKNALKELKTSKTVGQDEVPDELLKHGSEQLHQSIHQIIVKLREDEELPTSWLAHTRVCQLQRDYPLKFGI